MLPKPGRKTIAALLLAAVAIGLGNVWVGSSLLAVLELTMIVSLVGIVAVRRLLERGGKEGTFSVDRFLSALEPSPASG